MTLNVKSLKKNMSYSYRPFTQVMSVKSYIERQPPYRPRTGLVNVKTLPLRGTREP